MQKMSPRKVVRLAPGHAAGWRQGQEPEVSRLHNQEAELSGSNSPPTVIVCRPRAPRTITGCLFALHLLSLPLSYFEIMEMFYLYWQTSITCHRQRVNPVNLETKEMLNSC